MNMKRNADHENGAAFGPCQGPTTKDGGSFFCQGNGTENVDPFRLGDMATAFGTAVLCTPCLSHREAQIIAESLEAVA
jgi:hypothetical protein